MFRSGKIHPRLCKHVRIKYRFPPGFLNPYSQRIASGQKRKKFLDIAHVSGKFYNYEGIRVIPRYQTGSITNTHDPVQFIDNRL